MATNASSDVASTKKPLATCVFRVQVVHKRRMRQSVFAAQRKHLVNGLLMWNSSRALSGVCVVLAIFPHFKKSVRHASCHVNVCEGIAPTGRVVSRRRKLKQRIAMRETGSGEAIVACFTTVKPLLEPDDREAVGIRTLRKPRRMESLMS